MLRSILFLVLFITTIQYGASNIPPKWGTPPSKPPKTKPSKCGPNEKLIQKKTSCPGDSCITQYVLVACDAKQQSAPGCVCKDGYLRNFAGSCIPQNKCEKPPPPQKPPSKNPPPENPPPPNPPPKNPPLRNPPPKNPPTPKCGANETPTQKKTSCPGDSCRTKYVLANCAADQPSTPGCVCLKGYLRNAAGSCIQQDQCLNAECVNDPNAVRGCGNRCGRTCDDYKNKKKPCPLFCLQNGCDCKSGYVYDTKAKICVKPQYCKKTNPPTESNKKCGPNEKLIGNKIACNSDSCDIKYYPRKCAPNQPSSPGCVCKDGYLRNAAGNCIPEDNCPGVECVDDPNAVKGCGNRCKRTCKDYKDKQKACTRECSPTGCDCPSHLVYDENVRRCVSPTNCTAQCYGAHEEYTTCYTGQCRAKTCDQLGKPIACPRSPRGCQGGCICKEGYVRRSTTGKCIDAKTCPSCGNDTNAVYGCGNPCGNSCTDFYKKSLIICAQYCEVNGCDCREGFVRDQKVKKCVKPEECSDYGCPGNSTYVSCNAPCPTDYCPTSDGPKPQCSPPNPCGGGCRCKINYRLNSQKQCILARECPPIECTRPNEEFNSCPSDCLNEQCADRNNPPAVCNNIVENCDPRCVCKKGTWRDQKGVCVPANECPSQPPAGCDTAAS